MATYFHGSSEIQADGLQTLYLMNPGYVGYSDTQSPANMVFLNHNNPPPQTQQNHHHLVGIPLQTNNTATNSASSSQGLGGRQSSLHAQHEMSAIHGFLPRVHYNLWTSMDQGSQQTHQQHQLTATSAATANNSNSVGGIAATDVSSQLGLRRSVMPPSQQGLSLSLSPQQPIYGSYRPESEIPAGTQAPAISPISGGGSSSPASGLSNGISGVQSVLFGSKYLKAAQQLLDEMVNVRNGLKDEEGSKGVKEQSKMNRDSTAATGEGSSVAGGGETSTKRGTDLSTAERQELQMKKAKLVSMLDEVEQRYRQYHHQMQIVVSSFEQATGFGCAKTYTALALQTISKQFRCLKDAISGQIRQSSKSLGEEEYCLGGKTTEGGSRLRFVDHQLRQQRALQQLGMIQHNAWRPQRGLPERSVSVLRAWLFEHFLHPYPKDSDKHMLAKQTGLTRSQVSNWFINARVRLWKPMVEEMYLEEIKEHEQNGGSEDKTSNEESKSTNPQEKSPVRADQNKKLKNSSRDNINSANPNASPPAISSPSTSTIHAGQGGLISLIGSSSSDVEAGFIQGSPKKSRTSSNLQNSSLGSFHASMEMEMEMDDVKPVETTNRDFCANFGDDERQSRDGGYSLITRATSHGGGGGFGGYSIGELGGRFEVPDHHQFPPRFSGNNGSVSLTLGLPHCENLSLSGTHHQQSYLSNHHNIQLGRRLDQMGSTAEPNDFCGITTTPNSHSTATYENINLQNRKRFVAHQLLPDFVA